MPKRLTQQEARILELVRKITTQDRRAILVALEILAARRKKK
jgi:hypothetical protein